MAITGKNKGYCCWKGCKRNMNLVTLTSIYKSIIVCNYLYLDCNLFIYFTVLCTLYLYTVYNRAYAISVFSSIFLLQGKASVAANNNH